MARLAEVGHIHAERPGRGSACLPGHFVPGPIDLVLEHLRLVGGSQNPGHHHATICPPLGKQMELISCDYQASSTRR